MAAANQTPPVPPPAPQPPTPFREQPQMRFEGHGGERLRGQKAYPHPQMDPHVINVPQQQPQPQLNPRLFHDPRVPQPQQQHEFRLPLHPRGPSFFQEPIYREIRPEPKEKEKEKSQPKVETALPLNSNGTLPPVYQGWMFTKLDPETPGGKKTWSRAIKSEMPVSHADLAAQVRRQRDKGISVLTQYNGLNTFQRAQVDRLVEEKNKMEKDQRLEWKLASVKKEERNIGLSHKETVSMQVIVKKILKPAVTQSPKEKAKAPSGIVSDLNAAPAAKPDSGLKGVSLGAGVGPSHNLQSQKGGYPQQPGQPMMIPAGGNPHHFQQQQQVRPNVIYVDPRDPRLMPAQPQSVVHGPQQQQHPMHGGPSPGQQHGRAPVEIIHEHMPPQGHAHSHPQAHPQVHVQGHPQAPPQGHPQVHPQAHAPQGYPHGHFQRPQDHFQGHQEQPLKTYHLEPQGGPKKQPMQPTNLPIDPHFQPKSPKSPKKPEKKSHKKVEEWVENVTDTSDSESEPEVSLFDSSENETVITPPSSSAGKSKHKDKHRRGSAAKDHSKRNSRQSREGHRPVYREHERRQVPPPLSPKESSKEPPKDSPRILDDEDYVVIPASRIIRGNPTELRRQGSQRPAERPVLHGRGASYAYDDGHEQDRFASLGIGRRDSLVVPRRISETPPYRPDPYRPDRFDSFYEPERDYGDRGYARGPDPFQEVEDFLYQEKMDRLHSRVPRRYPDGYGARPRDLRDLRDPRDSYY